ncbi:ADP-ribosylation/Crystallin J1 (fragment) [uncultured Desulfobacterium sp.]|uniref:ADP-ribosylation/Crystallin J1 n=1 Tax=uncultured Desulfobacterium sp. TaxID=201089 RepID=A0A445MZ56_9BACT
MAHQIISDPPAHRIPDSVPFPRSYWVIPGKLLAGCYPGSPDKEDHDKLKALIDHGIRHVINLMAPDEVNWNGKPFVPYEAPMKSIAESMGHTIYFERMPIRDTWIPSRIEMSQILDHIDQAIQENKPVYIHCWGGRGRTGTVAGCYLARHGISPGEKALELIRELRRVTEDCDQSSPETLKQRDLVISWVKGE